MQKEVPSPIDLRLMSDARAWEATANAKRPVRAEFFDCFSALIKESQNRINRVLELGSGPGFLAAHLLNAHPDLNYVALDFSSSMHELARARLGPRLHCIEFVERSFREASWASGLGTFDAVVTNQAVHELRHKSYVSTLHKQVRNILGSGGKYLVCDHYYGPDGMSNDQLYLSVQEQCEALQASGFATVNEELRKDGLVLHSAT